MRSVSRGVEKGEECRRGAGRREEGGEMSEDVRVTRLALAGVVLLSCGDNSYCLMVAGRRGLSLSAPPVALAR